MSVVYRRKDSFYTRAKTAGYRSRAAFKLEELATTERLLRRGDTVIDIGAWPGGWLQVAARLVGPGGRVIGIDLQPIAPLPDPHVSVIAGDITLAGVQEQVLQRCGGQADVVLSDLAPKLTGVRVRDEARAQALVENVLEFARRVLRPGGVFIVKLFMSDELPQFTARLRGFFRAVRTTRPEATRKASSEIYAVATGFVARSHQ